jgi:putative hydrolase of HD superfamily
MELLCEGHGGTMNQQKNFEKLNKQMQFILELDKLKQIFRQTYLADASRKENDAEHSWHLAMMVMLLSEYANEPINVEHTMKLVLLHDVIEIDAGDTYAYDEAGNATKKEREQKAAERIFSLLPNEQGEELKNIWEEFEACETPEAKFASTLDKIQPILLNDASGGLAWREHGIRLEQTISRNKRTHEGSELLWEYAKNILEQNAEKGNLM